MYKFFQNVLQITAVYVGDDESECEAGPNENTQIFKDPMGNSCDKVGVASDNSYSCLLQYTKVRLFKLPEGQLTLGLCVAGPGGPNSGKADMDKQYRYTNGGCRFGWFPLN